MTIIADILLLAGVLGAAIYCMILSRRLSRFNSLETGMGSAIAVLSAQVDDMTKALENARESAHDSSHTLVDLTNRAEGVAQRLELLVASMHDLPAGAPPVAQPAPHPEAAVLSEAAEQPAPIQFRHYRTEAAE